MWLLVVLVIHLLRHNNSVRSFFFFFKSKYENSLKVVGVKTGKRMVVVLFSWNAVPGFRTAVWWWWESGTHSLHVDPV